MIDSLVQFLLEEIAMDGDAGEFGRDRGRGAYARPLEQGGPMAGMLMFARHALKRGRTDGLQGRATFTRTATGPTQGPRADWVGGQAARMALGLHRSATRAHAGILLRVIATSSRARKQTRGTPSGRAFDSRLAYKKLSLVSSGIADAGLHAVGQAHRSRRWPNSSTSFTPGRDPPAVRVTRNLSLRRRQPLNLPRPGR